MPIPPDILRAVNRSTVYGQISRWLIHDLRNPSQALTLITELMHDETEPEDEPPENTIREATRHLVRSLELLDRILRVPTRPEIPGPVSLRDHFEFLRGLHEVRRSPVTLDLSSALGPSLPAVTAVDDHLEQALLSLMMNALEACADAQNGHVSIAATPSNGIVVLEVEDNGRGVAREVRNRLFEPFVTTKTDRPFAGLGLAVARDIFVRVGGTLEYDSASSAKTRFVATLRTWK